MVEDSFSGLAEAFCLADVDLNVAREFCLTCERLLKLRCPLDEVVYIEFRGVLNDFLSDCLDLSCFAGILI